MCPSHHVQLLPPAAAPRRPRRAPPTCCPLASRKAPMDAARPMHTVLTSGLMWRMVSNSAMPAERGSQRRRAWVARLTPPAASGRVLQSHRPTPATRRCDWQPPSWHARARRPAGAGRPAASGGGPAWDGTGPAASQQCPPAAAPAVTLPPGLLMYMVMSFSASTLSKYRSCATSRLAMSSSTGPPMRTMRCGAVQGRAGGGWVVGGAASALAAPSRALRARAGRARQLLLCASPCEPQRHAGTLSACRRQRCSLAGWLAPHPPAGTAGTPPTGSAPPPAGWAGAGPGRRTLVGRGAPTQCQQSCAVPGAGVRGGGGGGGGGGARAVPCRGRMRACVART
jgi:hypothetical protein